jgi:hypothetical protein
MIAMAVGTGVKMVGQLQQGKMAEKIGKQRAAVDTMKAQQAWENAKTEADITAEKRNRLIATQKSQAAAGGIMINSPVVDVIEEDTNRIVNADISNILRQGRQEKTAYLQSAAYERAMGKAQRKQSIWDAVGTGVSGAGSIAWMGYDAGMWGGGSGGGFGLGSPGTGGYHQY